MISQRPSQDLLINTYSFLIYDHFLCYSNGMIIILNYIFIMYNFRYSGPRESIKSSSKRKLDVSSLDVICNKNVIFLNSFLT